jgi:hypothetical protein
MSLASPPIQVVHLFPKLDLLLIGLLRSLTEEQWHAPTVAGKWRVKDVAAHLLDTNMRRISMSHGYFGDPPIELMNSYQEALGYLNRLNTDWVTAMKRVSPQQITYLLESTGQAYCALIAEEPLFAPAPFAVDWAGEKESVNWFHIARDYTEKWHHQMQIRDAVGEPDPLMTPELYHPCMDTFMRGLPYALREVKPAEKTVVQVSVEGETGDNPIAISWWVLFENDGWKLVEEAGELPKAQVQLLPSVAWKLFTKGMTPTEAVKSANLVGDEAIYRAVLRMISVMA